MRRISALSLVLYETSPAALPRIFAVPLFYNERNAYITGSSLILFIILNRLVNIQDKLYEMRQQVKTLGSGAPSSSQVIEDLHDLKKTN